MRPYQNLSLPPRIYPLFNTICDPTRIYTSLPEYTHFQHYMRPYQNLPPLSQNIPPFQHYMRAYQNLPLPPRIYPLSTLYAILPEYTPPSQNIPTFNTICDPTRIYPPPLSQNIPPFQHYMRSYQNIHLPPRIYPLSTLYATLPESTPPPSPRIYPLFNTIRDPTIIYPSLPKYTPVPTTICDLPRIHPCLPEYTPFSNNYIFICDPPRIYPSLPEYTPFSTVYATLLASTPPFQIIAFFFRCCFMSNTNGFFFVIFNENI